MCVLPLRCYTQAIIITGTLCLPTLIYLIFVKTQVTFNLPKPGFHNHAKDEINIKVRSSCDNFPFSFDNLSFVLFQPNSGKQISVFLAYYRHHRTILNRRYFKHFFIILEIIFHCHSNYTCTKYWEGEHLKKFFVSLFMKEGRRADHVMLGDLQWNSSIQF